MKKNGGDEFQRKFIEITLHRMRFCECDFKILDPYVDL